MRVRVIAKLVVVAIVGILFTQMSAAQSMQELYADHPKVSARIQALRQQRDSTKDSSTIALLEQWVRATRVDEEAYETLAKLYRRNGREQDALYADSLAMRYRGYTSPRQFTRRLQQKRYGTYKVYMPSEVKEGVRYPLLLILHGNGNTSQTMLNWFASIKLDSVIAVFPEAPYPKMIEAMAAQREMYSASGGGLGFPDNMQSSVITMSARWYHDVLEHARNSLPVSIDLPMVIGFSQGGFYTYVLATQFPASFKSIVSISASMYAEGGVEQGLGALTEYGIDALVTHGTKDATVPFQTGELISGMLTHAGVDHQFVPFDGGHWPNEEISARIHQWIVEHLR